MSGLEKDINSSLPSASGIFDVSQAMAAAYLATPVMAPTESMRAVTEGSYLGYVSEFEIAAGTHLEQHRHNTHEYYYMLRGKALMQIGPETREVGPGDLIYIPPNAVHSITPLGDEPMRALAFAASFLPPGGAGTEAEKADFPTS